MENKPDIIWVSTQDWNEVWTRKQRFAQLFARSGHRVLYIESQLHWLGYLRKIKFRFDDRLLRFLRSPKQVEPNLYIATPPLFFPGQMMSTLVNKLNKCFLIPYIKYLAKAIHFNKPVLWIYPPDSVEMIGKFDESIVVFDCVDDWSQFKGLVSSKTIQSYMRSLFQKADLVVVTHDNLYKQASFYAKKVHLVPNGVEHEHFERALQSDTAIPDDIQIIPKPRIGFIGSIEYWLDFELIHYLASKRPSWSFVFIGPVSFRANIGLLTSLPNVHFLGFRPYKDLPGYLKAFDVCINPFKLDNLSHSVDPLKVYEYLAAGKAVVSVDMPAMRKFGNTVEVAHDPESFLISLDAAVCSTTDGRMINKRIMQARTHSWNKRFELLRSYLMDSM